MALKLKLLPDRQAYQPGGTVGAIVEVITQPVQGAAHAAATHFASLTLECSGVERVDPSWVAPTWQATVQPSEKDTRRIARTIFRSQPVKVLESRSLLPDSRLLFLVRLRLPEALPPTFRGATVSYSYQLQATAHFAADQPQLGMQQGGQHSGDPKSAVSQAASERGAPAAQQAQSGLADSTDQKAHATTGFLRFPPGAAGTNSSSNGAAVQHKGAGVLSVRTPIVVLPQQQQRADAPADAAERQQPGTPDAFGEADPAVLAYQLGQEQLDLLLDCTDLLASNGEVPSTPPQKEPGRLSSDAAAPQEGAHSAQANGLRSSGPSGSTGAGEDDAPTPSRRLSRQATADSDRLVGVTPRQEPSPMFRSYNLKLEERPLLRVALHPPLEGRLQPGCIVAGTLDLRHSHEAAGGGGDAPRCVQVVIMLETEEAVQERWQATGRKSSSGGAVVRRVLDEHQELTPDTLLTHFIFSLPLDAAPSFSSQLVSLRWLLRFEFTAAHQHQARSWAGARRPEQLTWLLPLHVYPQCNT